jgi:hypothetical protein
LVGQINVPPPVVAFSTQVPFVVALIGITYSIMSASWDPDVSALRNHPLGDKKGKLRSSVGWGLAWRVRWRGVSWA